MVSALLEDWQGHLWFGTGNDEYRQTGAGLSRYDGHNWTTYTTADGLASATVSSLVEDGQGRLWVGTDQGQGICQFDGTRFAPVDALGSESIETNTIAADGQGHLWFGVVSKGVRCFDGAHCKAYTVADGLANDQV